MIRIEEKPVVEPKVPSQLATLIPYRVVEVADSKKSGVEVGDIVLRFPHRGGGQYILNVTKQIMLWDSSNSDSRWSFPYKCLRAHNVRTITFCVDEDDRPE